MLPIIHSVSASPARHLPAAQHAVLYPPPHHNSAQRVLEDGQATVRWLLARYASLDPQRDASAGLRSGVSRRMCAELAVHMHVEEEVLFPRLREVLADCSPLDQAEVEHECVRGLMEGLMDMAADDPMFDASVMVLGQIFDMHLQREVSQIFPLLNGSGLKLRELGALMSHRRADLLAEIADGHGLRFENEEADPVGQRPR